MAPNRGVCFSILNIMTSVVLELPSSTGEELDEKTRDAERAKASMDTQPPSEISTALHIDSIIPDVLDRAPELTASISWTSGAKAQLGNKLSPKAVAQPPHLVTWHSNHSKMLHKNDHYFTMLLTGPDHPSRETPYQREFLYWHQGNIPGSLYLQGKRDTIVEYLGPNPANGTGSLDIQFSLLYFCREVHFECYEGHTKSDHRFVLFIYQQPSELKFDEPVINETNYGDPWRIHWNTRQFAKKYNLGNLHAISYFFAKFEG